MRLAVLISGGGRTALNLHRCIREGSLDATIEWVISSRGDAPGVERSSRAGIPTMVVERKDHTEGAFHQKIQEAVADVDLVCMAGFLSFWRVPDEWYGRVINIHPALLPDFGGRGMYGRRVHEAVLAASRTESGCTVHLCDNEYDHGPTVLQRRVPVLADDTVDTLAARVFAQECIAYPQAIGLFSEDRIQVVGREVRVLGCAADRGKP